PGLSGEFIERHAAPAKAGRWRAPKAVDAYVHEDFVVGFEMANLSQGDVVRKSHKAGDADAAPLKRARGRARRDQKKWQRQYHDQNQQAQRNQGQSRRRKITAA